jgi:hypothetical protein
MEVPSVDNMCLVSSTNNKYVSARKRVSTDRPSLLQYSLKHTSVSVFDLALSICT